MNWIKNFDLFLFDLDGLLVNTEELHFLAYQRMCEAYGLRLPWDFSRYCQAAHYDSTALRDQIYDCLPELQAKEPHWDVLYSIKKQAILELLQEGGVELMPGVKELLIALQKAGRISCVVTHSPDVLVDAIRKQNPSLQMISEWITRHDYSHPKPNPECYRTAIERFSRPGDRVIGFEDTPRGLLALLRTPATPVLITSVPYLEVPDFLAEGAFHFSSLQAIPSDWTAAC